MGFNSRMAFLPTAADIIGIDNLQGLKALVGVPDAVWTAFQGQVGDPGGNIQVMASLPDFIIAQACTHATFPDGTHFNPVNATQVGLLWRVSRKSIFLKNGGADEDFVDLEPWVQPQQAQVAGTAVPDPSQKGSGVKENVLKRRPSWTNPTSQSWCQLPRTRCRNGSSATSR